MASREIISNIRSLVTKCNNYVANFTYIYCVFALNETANLTKLTVLMEADGSSSSEIHEYNEFVFECF